MDSNKFEKFRQRIEKRMATMDAKLSFINKGFTEFQPRPRWTEFKDFQQEMTDFIRRRTASFSAEQFLDHDQRLKKIEKHLNL
ncbi:MAG: hypothetical protein AAF632_23890 [Bacteroidota bacterium]